MACCLMAPSHDLSQCWSRFMSPYDITRPQWVKMAGCLFSFNPLTEQKMPNFQSDLLNCLQRNSKIQNTSLKKKECCMQNVYHFIQVCLLHCNISPVVSGFKFRVFILSSVGLSTGHKFQLAFKQRFGRLCKYLPVPLIKPPGTFQ